MIVADTSVWIDWFRDADKSHVDELQRLLDARLPVALTDVVLTEILQGLRSDDAVARVEQRLEPFEVLRLLGLEDFRRAAALYRTARRGGATIRRTLDCLIASVCVRENVPILHADADFDHLARHTDLRVHRPRSS